MDINRTNNVGKYHFRYLDLIRIIAVFLVAYGHLVTVAMYATSVPGVIPENNSALLPLLDSKDNSIGFLEYLFSKTGTQTAVVGVVIFFLLTGYLSVDSINHSSPRVFLKNRVIRCFPGIWASSVVICITQWLVFKRLYSWEEIFNYSFLLYPITQTEALTGVIWTLAVEFVFYALIAIIGKTNISSIIFVNIISLFCIYMHKVTLSPNLFQICYYLKFLPIIMVGVAIKICENSKFLNRTIVIGASFFGAWANLNLNKYLNGDETTYPKLMTLLEGTLIFFLFYFLFSKRINWDKKINRVVTILSEYSFMFYLLQVQVGFSFLFFMKRHSFVTNNYLLVGLALLVVLIISILMHYLIEKPLSGVLKRLFRR